jgi:hypothetical protein
LCAPKLRPKLQDLAFGLEQLFFLLLARARLGLPCPLVEAMARDPEIVGDLLDPVASLKNLPHGLLPELRRVLVMLIVTSKIQFSLRGSTGVGKSNQELTRS